MDISRRRLFRGREAGLELRPPWVLNPVSFTDDCTRCGRCVERCPENILVVGDGGFPSVDFSWGECTFCRECTGDCEAKLFNPDADSLPWTYTAFVAESCLAHAGVMCRSCEDSCEVRAIRFPLAAGKVPAPRIDTEACTGCGACVAPCPQQSISLA